jgi:hypothetical protein
MKIIRREVWAPSTSGAATQTFPLKVSPNGRYLTYQDGTPFLIVGDSPQGLMYLSLADMETYMADRAGRGFNSIQVHLLCGPTFGGGSNGATYDGITPFTTAGDISTPRETYFDRVDAMLAKAASYGFCVHLTAAETIDWESTFQSNGTTKCRAFGNYLGQRYANTPNIVWNYGNDFQDWASNTAARNAVLAVANGIKDYDSNHIHTAWLDYLKSAARDMSAYYTWDLDASYNYYPQYAGILEEYALSPAKPVFLIEANYEDESLRGYLTTPNVVRRQEYWTMTSGACGSVYCHSLLWNFASGWASVLGDTGAQEVTIFKNFFGSLKWWLLVPDPTHVVLTAGYGTYAATGDVTNTNDYASCSLASDGSFLVAYLPDSRQVTIAMSKITTSANALCRWFNPQTAAYTTIGTYATSGTRNFTPSAGDWVLLVEAA